MLIVTKGKKKFPTVNVILFFATLLTMVFAPLITSDMIFKPSEAYKYITETNFLGDQIEFAIALMAILIFHEFGHYFAGRRRGVFMSFPYFLPAPNIAGTFGAVIKSRSPITNRRDLIEVGATGPVAGFIISLIVLSIGLNNSEIRLVGEGSGLILGDSLLLKFLTWLIVGPIPEGYDFYLSSAAFAGWVGLLVTMLNLLPLGQLDGGHIIYGLFGKWQHTISKLFAVAMMILGFWWPGWWFFGVLVFLFGLKHPPTLNDNMVLPASARWLGYFAIFIFIISFVPIPFALPV
jgi:membrane-associated protease RseP (regulator of RpoE activity)